MLKIFLSSTYQDLGEARSEILKKIDTAFAGVGMEEFIPDGTSSHEICIKDLKESDIVIFLLSSNSGSLIDICKLKENCKAECPMKTGEGNGHQISYTHCEFKTTIAEGILHHNLGILYAKLGQFEDARHAYTEALEIRKKLADKNPDVYNPYVATSQNNLGILYVDLGRFEEAETTHAETLGIYKELASKNPDTYNPYVVTSQNNLGILYADLGRFEEAETAYIEALEIYKELADKNPDAYNLYVATTQNNLGNLHTDLGRFEEAEHAYTKALEIYKESAKKNPDVYLFVLTQTKANLGILYHKIKDYSKAE